MVVPHAPGLFMIGLLQPVGPTIPLVEIQGQWVARVLAGHISLPERGVMDREIAKHRKKLEGRYVGSARYTLEVDFREYAAQMRRDMRNGKAAV